MSESKKIDDDEVKDTDYEVISIFQWGNVTDEMKAMMDEMIKEVLI